MNSLKIKFFILHSPKKNKNYFLGSQYHPRTISNLFIFFFTPKKCQNIFFHHKLWIANESAEKKSFLTFCIWKMNSVKVAVNRKVKIFFVCVFVVHIIDVYDKQTKRLLPWKFFFFYGEQQTWKMKNQSE